MHPSKAYAVVDAIASEGSSCRTGELRRLVRQRTGLTVSRRYIELIARVVAKVGRWLDKGMSGDWIEGEVRYLYSSGKATLPAMLGTVILARCYPTRLDFSQGGEKQPGTATLR